MRKYNDLFLSVVTAMARLYRSMPLKPFSGPLQKMYCRFLNSENNSPFVLKVIDGINYELDLREVIDSEMYYKGSREPATSKTLEILCSKDYVVFDVGANVGSHTLPIASLVGETGHVYAFEPVPWAVRKLRRNLGLNSFKNVVIETVALSDRNSEAVKMEFRASFKIGSASGVGPSGEIDDSWWQECDKVTVPMRTIDSYVEERGIPRLDLIKLDVDGFEGKVIRGALNTLRKFTPILIMEVAPAWVEMRDDSMVEILCELEQLGYKPYTEVEFKEIENIIQVMNSIEPGGGFNIVLSTKALG